VIQSRYPPLGSPRLALALHGVGVVVLTLLLIPVLRGGGNQFLQAILGALGALVLLRWPHWGVLLLLSTWLAETSPRIAGIGFLSVSNATMALLFIPLALTALHDRQIWVWRVPQVKILLAIGALFLISTWWSDFRNPETFFPELDNTARMLEIFLTRLLFLVFFLYFMTTRQRIEIAAGLVLVLIVLAAISSFITGGNARGQASFGLATNSNRLAFICVFGASLVWFYRSYAVTRTFNALTAPLIFFLGLVALSTGSRSGLLEMLVLAGWIMKEQEGWSATQRARSFLVLGSVVVLLLAVVPTAQFMRATTFDPTLQAPGKTSLDRRIETASNLVQIIASQPILGIGIGNFRWVHQTYFGDAHASHNSYLRTFAEGGIAVFALYLLLFYVTYRTLKQVEKSGQSELLWLSKAMRVNLILFLIFSAFADFWLNELLYLIVGSAVAMSRLAQRQVPGLAASAG
jgi:O-antigen ligase